MSKPENPTISLPPDTSEVGDTVSTADHLDETTEKLIDSIRPVAVDKSQLSRIANADPCYLEILAHLEKVQNRPAPTAEAIRLQWKAVLREHVKYMRMKFGAEHLEETVRVLRGRLNRRLMELREEYETKRIHEIQKKLGSRFLKSVPTEQLSLSKNAALRSMRRGERFQSQPPPSESTPAPSESGSETTPS